MRQPLRVLRYLVILLGLVFATHAHADDRSDARAHYQAGVKHYASGDYRAAIREFSAAQQIAPAELNNYNLALCYDKLGDAEPAIQYYRAFLDKQPSTDKRAEIQASIDRLDAALRSAAKKADEARRPAPVPEPIPGPSAGSELSPPITGPVTGPAPAGSALVPDEGRKSGPAIAGTLGTPGAPPAPSTGDSQLDRVNAIDIDQVRDQRLTSGFTDSRGPAPSGDAGAGPSQPAPGQPGAVQGSNGGQPLAGGAEQPKKPDAIYKKWWFWVIVGASGYVVYQLATSESSASQPNGRSAREAPTGLTLLRW